MNPIAIGPVVSNAASNQDLYSILVLKKAMNATAQQGQDMVALLSQMSPPASPPHLGNSIDILA